MKTALTSNMFVCHYSVFFTSCHKKENPHTVKSILYVPPRCICGPVGVYKVKQIYDARIARGQSDWLERSLWRAGQKLNQPISNPAHFLTSVSSQFVRMEAVKFSGFLMAKPVTFDSVFQNREQDGDPSKHAWAKPGSVNSQNWKDSTVKCLNLVSFKGDDFALCLTVETRPSASTACRSCARRGPSLLLANWWVNDPLFGPMTF